MSCTSRVRQNTNRLIHYQRMVEEHDVGTSVRTLRRRFKPSEVTPMSGVLSVPACDDALSSASTFTLSFFVTSRADGEGMHSSRPAEWLDPLRVTAFNSSLTFSASCIIIVVEGESASRPLQPVATPSGCYEFHSFSCHSIAHRVDIENCGGLMKEIRRTTRSDRWRRVVL